MLLCLFSNRSQMTSKCGKNKKVAQKATRDRCFEALSTQAEKNQEKTSGTRVCSYTQFLGKPLHKGPFTQAIFVAATRCNFCRAKIASSFKHVRNPCDIAATNRTKNRTWFTRAILKLQP